MCFPVYFNRFPLPPPVASPILSPSSATFPLFLFPSLSPTLFFSPAHSSYIQPHEGFFPLSPPSPSLRACALSGF